MLVLVVTLVPEGALWDLRHLTSIAAAALLLAGGLVLGSRPVRNWIRARQYGTA